MSSETDWQAWHEDYGDPASPLARRLKLVQGHIARWLDERDDDAVRVLSACAGQGHDLLGVLSGRPDRHRVRAHLLEFDTTNVAVARARAVELGLVGVEVRQADAGRLGSYAGAVPADLVLFAGIFGNISDPDIERSVRALPQLCALGATVIWTRTRRAPDRTPAIRAWFADAGFDEVAFDAPDATLASVGVHRLRAHPEPLADGRIFTFTR